MIPRSDPETRPQAAGYQVVTRGRADQYGAERGYRGHPRAAMKRAIVTRNGVPVKLYEYQGTGESMTDEEAEWWLAGTVSEANECQVCDL